MRKCRVEFTCQECGKTYLLRPCEAKVRVGKYCTIYCKGRSGISSLNREALSYLYEECKFSSYKIGQMLNCSNVTVLSYLKRNNISLRSISENASLCHIGVKHSKEWNKSISKGQLNMSDESRRNQVVGARQSFHRNVGKRRDLGDKYFRSRWEANYARYLNLLKKNGDILEWFYESDTFEFEGIKRGTRFYTPDFRIHWFNGEVEYHEVKGWDYPKGKTARKRFAKYYPHLKLVLIDSEWFKAAHKQGLPNLIEGWEKGNRRDSL